MSQTARMLVVVALSLLGLVSETMAQNNRFEASPRGFDNVAPAGATEFGAATDLSSSGDLEPADEATDQRETFDQFQNRGLGLERQPDIRRQPTAVIRDVQQSTPIGRSDSSLSARRSQRESGAERIGHRPNEVFEPRLAQNTKPNGGGLPLVDFGNQGRDDAANSTPSTQITQQDLDASYLNRDFRSTKPTSLLSSEKGLIDNQALNSNLDVPLRKTGQEAAGSALANAVKNGQQKIENAVGAVTDERPVPFWLTLALFISLPANLFFGWIAMSMHARYQDLLADMNASESRLSRESRRRRAWEDGNHSRTRREQDEEAFLQGVE